MTANSNKNSTIPSKGAAISTADGLNAGVLEFLRNGLDKNLFDAVLMPVKVPAGDSYAWVLAEDQSLFEKANVLPPIMSVQGGKTLSSLTKHGQTERKIAAVMRPCEIRATIELVKLKQIDLENIFLISIDCPGAMPIKDYLSDPVAGESVFNEAAKTGDLEPMRPICKTCVHFGITSPDLHIATFGTGNESAIIIPTNTKGEELLESAGMPLKIDTGSWAKGIEKLTNGREKTRTKVFDELKEKSSGMVNLAATLSKCISCHNCMSVCPICYCRRCYFESEVTEQSAEQYLGRAKQKGSVRFSPDILLFHLGRMSHMTMSCVSCGSCEDACPVDIPVAQLFSVVGRDTQALFDYTAGMNVEEPLPLKVFIKDKELGEIERICSDPLKGCDCK